MKRHTLHWIAAGCLALGSTAGLAADHDIERGRYLVQAVGCSDCHTPLKLTDQGPVPDLSRGLSGHPEQLALPPAPVAQGPWIWGGAGTNTAFWGPWGVSFASNLTPDKDTGIGNWSDASFVASLRTGKHLGAGRPILPPMPWRAIGQLTDQDLRAVFRYLQHQPAIKNKVPEPLPPR